MVSGNEVRADLTRTILAAQPFPNDGSGVPHLVLHATDQLSLRSSIDFWLNPWFAVRTDEASRRRGALTLSFRSALWDKVCDRQGLGQVQTGP